MNDLAATAQRLRDVKEATRHFLALWSLEQARDREREPRNDVVADELDTADVEAAIRELDVYGSESLIRGVLMDGDR